MRDHAEMSRLYIAVSGELHPGLAAAQAVHAAFQFSQRHPEITREWLRDSQFLVIVEVADEDAVIRLASRAGEAGLKVEAWHEPDRGDETTAVALEPGALARRLCANFPLLGRRPLALTG
jgi:peptidyl-tRNA hydrolase